MKQNPASQSGIFNPRILCAFALCSAGVLLAMLSLAATTRVEAPRANTSLPPDPANFLSTFGNDANRLPPGVPLPPGTQFSVNGQGDPSSNSPTAGFPGFAGMPLPPSGLDAPLSELESSPSRKPASARRATSQRGRKPDAQFSPNGPQRDPLNSSPIAGFSGFAGMPLRPSGLDARPGRKPGGTSGANSLGNPVFANQQPAPLSVPRPAASESTPLASGPASGWSIVNSPNSIAAQTTNLLFGVTCVSASDCWAVGVYYTGTLGRTLIERWNGTSWAVVTSPNSSATYPNLLFGVTCVSASDCWAVGQSGSSSNSYQTLIERWDGTSWAIVTSPNAGTNQTNLLFGVTCVSASDCWAVGGYDPGSSRQTLVERWNGTTWAIVTSDNLPTQGNSLSSVTCVSASDCWAVGASFTISNSQTLIERWNGTSWVIVTSANIPAAQISVLEAVTCVSASDCWAVGYSSFTGLDDLTLIERWNGTSWAIVPSPNLPAYSNRLYGVTCASASDCWAVGREDTGNVLDPNHFQTLVERWDGTLWKIVTSPNTSATQVNFLNAVTCVSGSDCWAIGYSVSNFSDQTLIERWDGTSWAIVPSDNGSSVPTNLLYGVTCVSVADCWAVGYPTLIERWDGTSWASVTSPNTSYAQNNLLYGVTCVSTSDCWAVGQSGSSSNSYQTLIERWDGTSWAIVASPNPTATSNGVLRGVTCVSASDCWAVGYSTASGGVILTLVERWNGATWTIVTSPNAIATQQNTLTSVTCASASDCWAVGYAIALNDQTLVERWDGTSWAVVASANTSATENNFLASVTCVSGSDCWAVGYAFTSHYQTLIERWDGVSWVIVSSPNGSATGTNFLNGVTCASASDCWAVGYSFPASAIQTLIERWNGTSWAIVTSPNTSATQHNILQSVTCASASNCWAVGYFIGSSGVQTLIEEYSPTVPPLTSIVSRKVHGSAGPFDIDLPLTGARGVECRSPGATGTPGVDYKIVFTFVNNLASCGTASAGSLSGGPNSNQCTVDLIGVANQQYTTIILNNVLDSQNNTGTVSGTMGVLVGDVNASGVVTSGDTNLCKAQALHTVTNANFRNDINASGAITTGDVNIIKQNALSHLPSSP